MSAERQAHSGKSPSLGKHFCDLRRQVGCGRHQHFAKVPSPCGGLLCRPKHNHRTLVICEKVDFVAQMKGDGGTYTYFSFCVSNLKMWTVSVLLEADKYRPSMLNASEQMLTHLRHKITHKRKKEDLI